ncbi:hypothetical protein ACFC09_18255 [Streptomyces sp. NPDC056161]|uniref:hypothetical protein n=1 Tax=Streptomyces sp. NPDC056161 TaxID=3345732 RepID=UPI0035E049F2
MSENSRASSTSRSASLSPAEMLLRPVDMVKTTVSHVPGAATVKGAFDSVLDTVGIVSPRSRRIAAYAGAGVLGAAGVVEWPVAATGAAVVWLTQSRPGTGGKDAPKAGARAAETRPAAAKPSAGRRAAAKPGEARTTAARTTAAKTATTRTTRP